MKQRVIFIAWLIALLCIHPVVFAQETTYDSALWVGALALWENENSLDYSVEYQLRLDDHMSSYSNDFVEFMGYKKLNKNVLFNGGYRFTRRTGHNESRLYFGGFLDLTKTSRGIVINPDQFRATLQIGYQHDFNAEFDNRHMGSNSIRWILVASKPAGKRMTPFLLGGVLTTWNDAYNFGIDKIRLGVGLVARVSDDEEIIAAAWLHDTVEDTPATIEDIEEQFGQSVAELVEELTDTSKPSDGNRAKRKAIDRKYLALASPRAKTVKLADLIDNCRDITKHDERFARVYLVEMGALLRVLGDGDETLYQKASGLYADCSHKLGLRLEGHIELESVERETIELAGFGDPHFKRMFLDLFTAKDIAEGLLSFDADTECGEVRAIMERRKRSVASVMRNGDVKGYMRLSDLKVGLCADNYRSFSTDQVVPGNATFSDLIHVLTRHDYCFVRVLGNVSGVISRDDMNKPVVRMWLFGIVTMIEMGLVQTIEKRHPEQSWQSLVSTGRLDRAKQIQVERQRRNQYCELIDCLQLSDKGQIFLRDKTAMEALGLESRSVAKRAIKELESLRNHLAHAQDIVSHDWGQIARLSQRMERVVRVST